MAIAAIRLPKGSAKREHAVSLAHSCSPMFNAALGRAGMILWRQGLVGHLGDVKAADTVLLNLQACIERQDEDALTKEILGTWEAYS